MSTAANSRGRNGGERAYQVMLWMGHHAWKVWLAYCVVDVAQFLTGAVPDALIAFKITSMVPVLTLWICHRRALCELCIRQWPLDPEPLVQRRMWMLRWVHRQTKVFYPRRRGIIAMSGLFVLIFLINLYAPHWVYVLVMVPLLGIYLPITICAVQVHTQLQAWCPWCRDDDGGAVLHEPSPDPTERATR